MGLKFFCISKSKKVYSEEDLHLKQIEGELKQLKKKRKQLISPSSSQVSSGSCFMGAPMIPSSCINTNQNINSSKELMSLDRQIDRLIEAKNKIIGNTTMANPT